MNFSDLNLHPLILKAVTQQGYTQPTAVQAKSIPLILQKKDVVVSAQTGTGKTAAFVLPALHHLNEMPPSKKARLLVLSPTRELACQISKSAVAYSRGLRLNVVSLVGGMSYHNQIKDLSRGADIIVATPGRLLDHLEQKRVDLSQVGILVLDEADRMLDMGFIDDVKAIAKLTPNHRQTLLFSATVDNKLNTVINQLLKNPIRIDLSEKTIASPQVKQELYKANNISHKTRLLKHFLNDATIYKAIIFSATKMHADKLAAELRDDGFSAAALHGDLRQNVRTRTLQQLRNGKIQFLVATDVAARGLDVNDITHVINYDLPRFCEDYVHRIGRTGRAGKTGTAISFVLPSDIRHVQRIERYLGQRLKLNEQIIPFQSQEKKASGDFTSDEKSIERSERFNRSDRPERFARPERFGRSDRNERFGRSEKSERFGRRDRTEQSGHRFERAEKPERFGRSDRTEPSDRFERTEKPERFGRYERTEKPERFGRSEKSERFGRSERAERPERFSRPERTERPAGGYAPGKKPASRSAKPATAGKKPFSFAKQENQTANEKIYFAKKRKASKHRHETKS